MQPVELNKPTERDGPLNVCLPPGEAPTLEALNTPNLYWT